MAGPDYSHIEVATATAVARTQGGPEDELVELLHLTAGKDESGTIVYRPFYTAARWIQGHPRWLIEAVGDAKFLNPESAVQELLALQASLDTSLSLEVPPEWAAEALMRGRTKRMPVVF